MIATMIKMLLIIASKVRTIRSTDTVVMKLLISMNSECSLNLPT